MAYEQTKAESTTKISQPKVTNGKVTNGKALPTNSPSDTQATTSTIQTHSLTKIVNNNSSIAASHNLGDSKAPLTQTSPVEPTASQTLPNSPPRSSLKRSIPTPNKGTQSSLKKAKPSPSAASDASLQIKELNVEATPVNTLDTKANNDHKTAHEGERENVKYGTGPGAVVPRPKANKKASIVPNRDQAHKSHTSAQTNGAKSLSTLQQAPSRQGSGPKLKIPEGLNQQHRGLQPPSLQPPSQQPPSQQPLVQPAVTEIQKWQKWLHELEQKPAAPRFKWLKDLIRATKVVVIPSPCKDKTNPVELGTWLDVDQVIVAISAVTEAVHIANGRDKNGQHFQNLYGLMSSTTLYNAKQRPIPPNALANARVARPRSTLMFPWVYEQTDLLTATGASDLQLAKIQEAAKKSDAAHIFLITVESDKSLPQIIIHDSYPQLLTSNAPLWQLVKREIRKTVSNFGVCDFPTVGNIPPPSSDEVLFEEELEALAAPQMNDWACGVHVILNAWAQAMQLPINPRCRMDKESYEMAVDIINLVLDGRAIDKMIAVLLIETGFVIYAANQRPRGFGRRINDLHDIQHRLAIDELLLQERLRDESRVDHLKMRHAQDIALTVSVQQNLTKDLQTSAVEEDDSPPVSPATLEHFLDMPEVAAAPHAISQCKELFAHLQQRNLVKEHDSEQLSQQSKDAFLKRYLKERGTAEKEVYEKEENSDLLLAYFQTLIDRYPNEAASPVTKPHPPIYPDHKNLNEDSIVFDFRDFLKRHVQGDAWELFLEFLRPFDIETNIPTDEPPTESTRFDIWSRWFYNVFLEEFNSEEAMNYASLEVLRVTFMNTIDWILRVQRGEEE
jgi:hypothetical protein